MIENGFKPSLVLLHGWGMNRHIWAPVIPFLSQHFELHALDLPGYGNSKGDGQESGDTSKAKSFEDDDYSLPVISERLLAKAPRRAIWLGWSLGATISLSIAINHPDRVEKLALISATPRFMQDADWSWGMEPELLQQLKESFDDYERGLKRFLMLQTSDRSVLRQAMELVGRSERPATNILHRSLQTLVEADLREKITCLRLDTFHVLGEQDRIVAPEASRILFEKLRLHAPESNHRLYQLKQGHLCFLESLESWLEDFCAFAMVRAA